MCVSVCADQSKCGDDCAGRDIEAAHASQIEKAVSSLERSSIVPLSQEDRTIVWMHCFTLWYCALCNDDYYSLRSPLMQV